MQNLKNSGNQALRARVVISAVGVVAAAERRQAFRRDHSHVVGASWSSKSPKRPQSPSETLWTRRKRQLRAPLTQWTGETTLDRAAETEETRATK